jgi:hypothetical protein
MHFLSLPDRRLAVLMIGIGLLALPRPSFAQG